jgi:pyruvate/2-oxoglutarate dehydrogenase complex dihydrolipoamide acyltransferase (E2) component
VRRATGSTVPRERRHTLYFLAGLRGFAPVFLDTEVDMTSVLAHRTRARASGRSYSIVTYVLHTAGRCLALHPAANAAFRGGPRPRLARYQRVVGKLTYDKKMGDERVVVSALLPDVDRAGLDAIQDQVEHYRDGDPASMPELAGVRALHQLPGAAGWSLYQFARLPLGRRPETAGTFSVTSLGHRPVDGFHSVGGTTVTLGLGRITDRPVSVDGRLAIAPVLRLNLTFDHRVIDGAEAADLLTDIKESLETFDPRGSRPEPGPGR